MAVANSFLEEKERTRKGKGKGKKKGPYNTKFSHVTIDQDLNATHLARTSFSLHFIRSPWKTLVTWLVTNLVPQRVMPNLSSLGYLAVYSQSMELVAMVVCTIP